MIDARLPTNMKPHEEAPAPLRAKKWTPAAAAKARAKAYAACGCRLCAIALNPPKTFAEGERFGYPQPDAAPPTVERSILWPVVK